MCAGGAPGGTAPGVRNRHRRGRPGPRGRQLAAGKPSFVRVKEFAEGEARLLLRNCGPGPPVALRVGVFHGAEPLREPLGLDL